MTTTEPIISKELSDKIDLLAFHLAPMINSTNGNEFRDRAAPFVETVDRILKSVETMKIGAEEFPDETERARAVIRREITAAIGIRMTDLFGQIAEVAKKATKDAHKRSKKRFGWRHRGES